MWHEITTLLYKELLLEWKQKYAFNGLLLYVLSMVVVIALAMAGSLNPLSWNILYWIIILFVAINAVAKSFMSEKIGHLRYLYALASPSSIMIAKLIYNWILLFLISGLTLFFHAFLGGIDIAKPAVMLALILLGSGSLSANLTLVTAISAQAENRTTLLAVLSFPLVIPILLMLIRISRSAIEGLASTNNDRLWMLMGMTVVLAVLSTILFPFVWRE
ncbi:MAG: heme exporter protein CcmB [Bacteroidota bacterium]